MTGIERLRKLSEDMLSISLWVRLTTGTEKDWDCYQGDGRTVNDELLSIADQIERESDVETVRADAMKAWEWVREHGGLDAVDAIWDNDVPLAEAVISELWPDGRPDECGNDDVMGELRRRLMPEGCDREFLRLHMSNLWSFMFGVMDRLGVDKSDSDAPEIAFDALDRRLMPEGMEWMLWDDGKPVTYDDAPDDVIGVYLALDGSGYVLMTDLPDQLMSEPSERVRRPAVPAGDGEPLEVGQTVWDTDAEADTPLTVVEVSSDLVRCEYTWKDGKTYRPCYPPDQLTHQRPDTWQRIEEDSTLSPEVYCHRNGIDISQKDGTEIFLADTVEPMARDLVRRCRALAERERGE